MLKEENEDTKSRSICILMGLTSTICRTYNGWMVQKVPYL